jgi:hypothetical protein
MSNGGGNGFNLSLGSTGVPFLTKKSTVPLYKNTDPRRLKPQGMQRPRVDIFDLSEPDQLAQYNKIWEAVGYGIARVADEDKHWVDTTQNWKVFVRWFIPGEMDPSELYTEQLMTAKQLHGRF